MLKGTQMVDRDSGQCTAALVIAMWRAAWIRRWFVQPAIVWCRAGLGGQTAQTPTLTPPLHFAHTPVEVAGPPGCGGGTTANVGEAMCAMGWFQCCGSGTKRGRT